MVDGEKYCKNFPLETLLGSLIINISEISPGTSGDVKERKHFEVLQKVCSEDN